MSEETIAQRVIRVIAKNKKMAPEELCAATRFDDLKMDSLDALNMIFALHLSSLQLLTRGSAGNLPARVGCHAK